MRFELFKNIPFDCGGIMPLFSSLNVQNAWFNAINESNKYVVDDLNYIRVGDPILIERPLDEIIDYTYGRMTFGSKWIYFSVVDAQANLEDQSFIYIKVDSWNTLRYQSGITLGRGQISRRNNFTGRPRQPHNPIKTTLSHTYIIGEQDYCWAIGCYTPKDDTFGILEYFAFPVKSDNSTITIAGQSKPAPNFSMLVGCLFDDVMDIPPANIKALWLTPVGPCPISETVNPWIVEENIWVLSTSSSYAWYRAVMPKTEILNFSVNIYTDEMHTGGFVDRKGNPVFTLPYGKSLNSVKAQLRISAQTCQVDLYGSNPVTDTPNELKCSIECEPISFTLDQYSQYFSGQRQIEIERRNLQSEQAFMSSVANVGNSAIWGGIAGGMAGAAAGALVGLGGSIISLGAENNYNPKFQAITDREYQCMPDSMSIVGTCITDFLEGYTGYYGFELVADNYSMDRMYKDIEEGGCYVQETVDNADQYVTEGALQGDFLIVGAGTESMKAQIAERFRSGVKMVLIA